MLIIAMPKSASTSLLHTLGDLYDLSAYQDVEKLKLKSSIKEFEILGNFHSDCKEIDKKLVEKWIGGESFYKQHVIPTENNLALLKKHRKVILLREPDEIILAYKRAQEKDIHKKREVFDGCNSNDDWLLRAEEIGLLDELNRFALKWKNDSSDKLIINYEDLVRNHEKIIKKVSLYFNIPIETDQIKLKKLRYSKHNKLQRFLYKLRKNLVRFFR